MSRRRATSAQFDRDAFTLLEVLAAILILMIWLTMLVHAGSRGLMAEGESRRRLEAAAIADNALAEIESKLYDGSAPEPSSDSREEDLYTITTTVGPLVEGALSATEAVAWLKARAEQGDGQPIRDPKAGPPAFADLLQEEVPFTMAEARKITVTVSWEEAARELSVVRTTFALDLEMVANSTAEALGIPTASPPDDLLPPGLDASQLDAGGDVE